MTRHRPSPTDRAFRADFAAGRLAPADFDHRAHVRLAYVHLAESDDEEAAVGLRDGLLAFLRHHGVDPSKYHETMTRAWLLAVRHFMESSPATASADEFIAANPALLDSKIMLTHYSADLLFSDRARREFVEPDRDAIPRHGPGREDSAARPEGPAARREGPAAGPEDPAARREGPAAGPEDPAARHEGPAAGPEDPAARPGGT